MVYYDLGIFGSFGDRRGGAKNGPPLAVRVTKISVAVRVLTWIWLKIVILYRWSNEYKVQKEL